MKKTLLFSLCLILFSQGCFAWGKLGHETVIAIAERHLTEKTKANIAAIMPYDMKVDAVWMDMHRNDADMAFTTNWHTFLVYPDSHKYDPNPKWGKGDAIYALNLAKYNLSDYKDLDSATVLMSLRMLIHFTGDMHCPVHVSYYGNPAPKVEEYKGEKLSFHRVYDSMPNRLFEGLTADQIAERIDNAKKSYMKKIAKGSFEDWAKNCGDNCTVIYDINPAQGKKVMTLREDTDEASRELIETQLRNAGYRLAYLLNEFFGK